MSSFDKGKSEQIHCCSNVKCDIHYLSHKLNRIYQHGKHELLVDIWFGIVDIRQVFSLPHVLKICEDGYWMPYYIGIKEKLISYYPAIKRKPKNNKKLALFHIKSDCVDEIIDNIKQFINNPIYPLSKYYCQLTDKDDDPHPHYDGPTLKFNEFDHILIITSIPISKELLTPMLDYDVIEIANAECCGYLWK